MRFFLLAKICRQQNTASSGQIYAGLRAPQTPRARLAAWIASQNYVLLFQPVAFIQAWPANIIPVFLLYRALYLPAVSIFISGVSRTITSRQLSSFLQSKSQPSGSQHHSIFCQSLQAKQQTNPQKQPQKKEAEASLEKCYCMDLSTAAT